MTMALTGKVMPYKRGFGPFPAEVYHAEFPQPYRGITTEQALADLERLFHGDVDPKSVAAIVIEPVQGEGGFNVAPFEFLRALRRVCDEHGIVLIADEVQGGIARTGKMFSIEHSGRRPRSHRRRPRASAAAFRSPASSAGRPSWMRRIRAASGERTAAIRSASPRRMRCST